MFDLDQTIKDRHSTRKFLSQPVPRALLDEALALAQLAPSNSNIQPWRLVFAQGGCRDRLQEALLNQAKQQPNVSPAFRLPVLSPGTGSASLWGEGITRDDKANRQLAVLRNYEFFGAPMVAIVCMHQDLGVADALSVGMYLQTLVLSLTARGIGTCVEVSLATYPEIIRNELNISPELLIICGLAVGYPDPDFPANHLHISRESVEKNVSFQGD